MKVKKTIKAKVVFLTKIKRQLLEQEYENLQRFLRGEKDAPLYSANKQQALRFYKHVKPDREYPLSIRKDLLKIERRDTKIAEYWARIPVKGRRGGVWVAIKPHCLEPDMETCESKLFKRKALSNLFSSIHILVKIHPHYICVASSPRFRIGLPAFPSCYAHIASASGRVLPEFNHHSRKATKLFTA